MLYSFEMKQMPATIKSCFRNKLSLSKSEIDDHYEDFDISEELSEMDVSTSKKYLNEATQTPPYLVFPYEEEDTTSLKNDDTFPSMDQISSCSSSSQSGEHDGTDELNLSQVATSIDENINNNNRYFDQKLNFLNINTSDIDDDIHNSTEKNDFLSPRSVLDSKRLLSRTSSSEDSQTRCAEKKRVCRKISEGSYFSKKEHKQNTNRKTLFSHIRKHSDVPMSRKTRSQSTSGVTYRNKYDRSPRYSPPIDESVHEQNSPKLDFTKSRHKSSLRRSISLPAPDPVNKHHNESLFKRIGSLKRRKEPLDSGILFPTEKDVRSHLMAKERGRRGAVISLEINQTVSFVKANNQDDTYCQFNFLPTKPISSELKK